ncbi:hypothetical protein [Rhizobium sp. Rhizsp42]|uniref:hypothetical protein n=1 Tax=Rhizobium sp. Rhizsp42 TaxID=3243034 RepID=UPI0039AEE7EA
MDHIEFDEARERRLELYYARQLTALQRAAASEPRITDALSVTKDSRLPRLDLEFAVCQGEYSPGRWPLVPGLGAALETYLADLRHLDIVRYSNSVVTGLTSQHLEAFEAVVAAARALEEMGWPVNWRQNVQKVLEQTEFGLRNDKLVDRFSDLPETVELAEEMLLLGTLTFYRQIRAKDGFLKPFKALSFSLSNRSRYEGTMLHLRKEGEGVPSRFRYCSDWISNDPGGHYRLFI